MVKIIIVEDEEKDQKLIQKIIDPFYFKFEERIKPIFFKKYTNKLQEEIDDQSERKIYILDICLDSKVTGLNIAMKIRENDWDSEIIFLTNHSSYEHKVYSNIFKIFRFIEKFDNMEERLSNCLQLILHRSCDRGMFKYKNSQINLSIYYKDILYIYRDKEERKLVIKTTNNSFKVSETIEEMLSDLDDRFKQVHRSCIVNKDRINKYEWNKGKFILDTSEEVDLLSKKYKESL